MEAKKAMFEVDSLMGDFSGEIWKITFVRDMIQGVIENGGGFDMCRNGGHDISHFWGLVHIIDDLEDGYAKLRAGVDDLFVKSKTETEAVE